MLISINGPLAGKLSIIQIAETYVHLLKRIDTTPPSKMIEKLYAYNIGWTSADGDKREFSLLDEDQLREYYHIRILGNVISFVDVLCYYLKVRLSNLNTIRQGRVDTEINTEKSPRFYYNLPGGVVAHIQNILTNHAEGIDYYDYERLRLRIMFETGNVLQTSGMIAPNQRCDETVKAFMDYRPQMLDAICSTEGTEVISRLADYLQMWVYVVRLYFGAVNLQDQDVANFSQLPPDAKTLTAGDDIITAFPAPRFESLKAFTDSTAGYASTTALSYLSSLNDYYLARD